VSESLNIVRLTQLTDERYSEEPEDETLGVVGEANTALIVGYAAVKAICRTMEKKAYRWGERYVLTFVIIDPEKYQGTTLPMYMRVTESTKRKHIPESAKLYKAACVAMGYRLPRGFKIKKSMFVGKTFRCRLRTVHEGAVMHTIVDTITEKV
jgi:hypothetical protein